MRLSTSFGTALALVLAALAAASNTRADDCLWWERSLQPERVGRVTVTGERGFPADLDGDRGTVALWRAGVYLEGTVPVSPRWSLRWTAFAEESSEHFSDPDAIVPGPGRLMEDGLYARLSPLAEVRWSTGWGLAAGPIVQTAGATGARFSETLTYGGQAAVRIPLGGTSALILGASAETTLEGSLSLSPLLDIEGSPSTGRFHIEYLRSGIASTGIRAAFDVTPKLSAGLLARYDARAWRLADDDRVSGGVFRHTRIAPGVDLAWRPSPRVSLSAAAWLNVYDTVRFDDRHGDRVTGFNADPSFILGLTLSIRF